jgi:hypothetical protein
MNPNLNKQSILIKKGADSKVGEVKWMVVHHGLDLVPLYTYLGFDHF